MKTHMRRDFQKCFGGLMSCEGNFPISETVLSNVFFWEPEGDFNIPTASSKRHEWEDFFLQKDTTSIQLEFDICVVSWGIHWRFPCPRLCEHSKPFTFTQHMEMTVFWWKDWRRPHDIAHFHIFSLSSVYWNNPGLTLPCHSNHQMITMMEKIKS